MTDVLNQLAAAWMGPFATILVQSTVFLVVALALVGLGRRAHPRLLRVIALAALVKFFVPPLVSWLPGDMAPALQGSLPAAVVSASPVAAGLSGLAYVFLAWALAAVALFGFRVVSARRLWRRLALGAESRNGAPGYPTAPVPVVVSPHCAVPVAIGFLRPRVVLPRAADAWSTRWRGAVIAHEVNHVRQGDHLVVWLVALARSIYFFHPGVWLLGRIVQRYSERCCDEVAVSTSGMPRLDYARGLVASARATLPAGEALAIVGVRPLLPHRVRCLTRPAVRTPGAWTRAGAVGCLALVVLLLSPRSAPAAGQLGLGATVPSLASVTAAPRGGFDALLDGLKGYRHARPAVEAAADAIVVRVDLDDAGAVIGTSHLNGGCKSSYEQVRMAIERASWEPALAAGTPSASSLEVAFEMASDDAP